MYQIVNISEKKITHTIRLILIYALLVYIYIFTISKNLHIIHIKLAHKLQFSF